MGQYELGHLLGDINQLFLVALFVFEQKTARQICGQLLEYVFHDSYRVAMMVVGDNSGPMVATF